MFIFIYKCSNLKRKSELKSGLIEIQGTRLIACSSRAEMLGPLHTYRHLGSWEKARFPRASSSIHPTSGPDRNALTALLGIPSLKPAAEASLPTRSGSGEGRLVLDGTLRCKWSHFLCPAVCTPPVAFRSEGTRSGQEKVLPALGLGVWGVFSYI